MDIERALAAPNEYKWELYNLTEDYSQANDLAAKMPDKLKEMQKLFDEEAVKVQRASAEQRYVRTGDRATAECHSGPDRLHLLGRHARAFHSPTHRTFWAGPTRLRRRSMCHRAAATGCSSPWAGRWGGYGLYMLKGKPVFNYNMLILAQYRWEGADALTPGKHTIVFDYTYDGPGIAKGGTRCAEGRRQSRRHTEAAELDRVPASG